MFDGNTQPYPARFYANTLTCYSFSKSLSLPGERIGYVAVNPKATDADLLVPMMGQISRGTGHNCPPSSIQLGVAKVIDETSDLSVYETNMNLLYDALTSLGFDVVRPGGTFYIFPKALEEDATAFRQVLTSRSAVRFRLGSACSCVKRQSRRDAAHTPAGARPRSRDKAASASATVPPLYCAASAAVSGKRPLFSRFPRRKFTMRRRCGVR